MRSALLTKILVSLALAFAAAAWCQPPGQQINPHTQIRWPRNCTGPGHVYNLENNTCIDMDSINPATQLLWPGGCSTASMVYAPQSNSCYDINAINPAAQVRWPTSCTSGVYSPGSNTCLPTGTAANPGGSSMQMQYNNGAGSFAGTSGVTYDGASGLALTGNISAATITAPDKGSQVLNVKAFGAKGDGVTDDAPAIRSATAAAIAGGGGTIYLPKGTYYFGSPDPTQAAAYIYALGSHVHFQCDPQAQLITQSSTTATIFMFARTTTDIRTQTGYQANTLAQSGSPTITITTPSNTAHFAVGDPIYIIGGPSIESGTDGEINWIVAIDSVGGVLTLRKPTSKPYTGNQSNLGTAGIVTVVDGAGLFYSDDSVEGCTANNIGADFAFFGQMIGGRLRNNTVTVNPSSTRGMLMNSAYPLADVEIAGNNFLAGAGAFILQLACGMRDFYLHNNTFTSGYGAWILNPSEGIINLHIDHNNFYLTVPTGYTGSVNIGALVFSTAYQVVVSNNIINMAVLDGGNHQAIETGLSNGTCLDCVIEGNYINMYGGTAGSSGAAIVMASSGKLKVSNNFIFVNNMHKAVIAGTPGGSFRNNTIHFINSAGNGLYVADILSADMMFAGNHLYQDSQTVIGIHTAFTGGGSIANNLITNATTAIQVSTGSPVIMGNACDNVATTTGCGVVPGVSGDGANGITATGALTAGTTMNAPQHCIGTSCVTSWYRGVSNPPNLAPTATVTDSFARAAGALGSNWSGGSTIQIVSSGVVGSTSGSSSSFDFAWYTGASFVANQCSSVTVQTPPVSGTGLLIAVNVQDIVDLYALYAFRTGGVPTWALYKFMPTNNIALISGQTFTGGGMIAGDVFQLCNGGGTLTVYRNGTQQAATAVDTTFTNGYPGFGFPMSGSARISSWTGAGTAGPALTLGGSALSVGCTDLATVTVAGAQTTQGCVMTGQGGNPANVIPQCAVTAVNTVTPRLCALVATTPASQNYQVRVIQ